VKTYDGHGKSTAAAHALNVFGTGVVNELDYTCTGTYQVSNNSSFSEDITCSGTIIAGVAAGQTFTQTGLHHTGHIGFLAQTLVMSDTSTNVENITFSVIGSLSRLCGSSGTAVKIR
jgi:hypothetical protein